MNEPSALRAAVAGLIGFAAAAEQQLLAITPTGEGGTPEYWAAAPLVAHNTEFRRQQVVRLTAVGRGETPPEFGDVDHSSDQLYAALDAKPAAAVRAESWQAAGDLIGGVAELSAEDLLEPARHPWLRGRQLWLQVVVRGFWHPCGHLGEYYLQHRRPELAIAVAELAVSTADNLGAPAMARGMAAYNLACARTGAGQLNKAAKTIAAALELNPDLHANVRRDQTLAALRDSGLLASRPPG